MIAEAFEMISDDSELQFDICEKAYMILGDLNFLPYFKEKQSINMANLAKDAERFSTYDTALQEMTFDVVMAISKICKLLNQVCLQDDTLLYDQTAEGNRQRNEVKARREH